MSSVELRDLSKHFGTVRAVDGVSLTLAEGSFTALLGPSGCGKSTLLRLIAGLDRPSAGQVFLDGREVTHLPPERRDVGMMFQSYALFPHMSVASNVAFPLKMGGERDRREIARRVEEALELVRLADYGRRGIRALSGGQQQRVALARAFVAKPKVLLLDEPLSNLDARLREDMQVELIDLHQTLGLTTVFVTHDQVEALSLADDVVLIRDGRIAQRGDPESLYSRPATAFAADFIGAANLLPITVSRDNAEGWVGVCEGLRFAVPAPADGQGGDRRLMVRQEDIALAERPLADHVNLPCVVQTRVYLGASVRYVAALGGQRVIVMTTKGVQAAAGADRYLAWRKEHSAVL